MVRFCRPTSEKHMFEKLRRSAISHAAPESGLTGWNTDLKLALISSGLGNTYRGFEISTARWFEALRKYTDLDVRLFAGGEHPGATTIWNIPRKSVFRPLRKLPFRKEENRWLLAFSIEELTFCFGLIPHLRQWRPDVVWLKDWPLAHLIARIRLLPGMTNFKIIFANGAALDPALYKQFDRIQQLHAGAYEQAVKAGIPSGGQMEVLGNCIALDPPAHDPMFLRASLGLRDSDFVVVCVAAWNKHQKRIDYLIDEVARIEDQSVKLLLCGEPEPETPDLKALAARKLGSRVQWLTLHHGAVRQIFRLCDVFVLASLKEGLPNALIEAALSQIPVVVHPQDGARSILQDDVWMTDLSGAGNLAARLIAIRKAPPSARLLQELSDAVARRFGDRVQAKKFEQMVRITCQKPHGASRALNRA
jgi:1,2-diacylglycerol 3-alpha-glucosyltransferase